MKILSSLPCTLMCSAIGMAATVSCNTSAFQTQQKFYYYPQKNLYYAVETNKYFYSLNGAKTWDSIQYPSPIAPTALGEKIEISSDDGNIWKSNAVHRQAYNGNLYQIINAATSVDTASIGVKERAVFKRAAMAPPQKKKDKPKKGLGKFLEKIFGKKKDGDSTSG